MRSWIILIFAVLLCACNTIPPNETIDGILEVPENRQNPDSRILKLVYKVLKAKKADSTKAPILYLQGGAGGATLVMEEFWENHPLRNDRDIVLMDQRGTGASEANCTETGKAMFAIFRQDLDGIGEYLAMDTLLSQCKQTIKKKGVDLAGYNSKENAADFEDLRKALGYGKWNLFGGSYGSRLGLTMMRDFPKSVRSAVLIGVVAPEWNFVGDLIPNIENSLFSVIARCEKNEGCSSRYPNLKERLLKALKKMQTEPLHLDYEGEPFVLNPQDALLLLQQALYNRYSIGNIPLLIEALESGEIEPISNALHRVELIYDFVNWPVNYSVMAFEGLPFSDFTVLDQAIRQSEIGFAYSSYSSGKKLLTNWHSYRATSIENQPVISEIPTLMTSGSLDPVTPPSNATGALRYLKNGYEIIFLDESHEYINPCFFQITDDFLNDPFHKPNVECSSKRNPIEWNLLKPAQ